MPFPTFEKKDDIPKGFEDDYEEGEDKKWRAKVPDVKGAQTALEAERTKAENEKKERIKAENALAELRRKEAAREGNISDEQLNALRLEDENKRKAELEPVKTELADTKAKLRKITLGDRLRALGSASGWLPDRAEDALDQALKRADLAEGSDTNIVVKDKDGKVTTEKVEDFLKVTFKKEKPWLYAGSGGSGSGAGGSTRTAGAADEEPPEPDTKQLEQKRATVAAAF